MTLSIELTDQEEARLAAAARMKGIPREQFVRELVIERLPSLPKLAEGEEDTTVQLFAQWDEEDASMTPEEIASAAAEWETLKANMNANRAATGEEPLF
jgi:hypothetical protein